MTTIKLKNGSGAPTAGDLAQGEPALDLTNKRLYTEDSGGTVIEVGTNPGVDVTFADNRKAIFGAGSDLQIYHNGTGSYIEENGTGNLFIEATNLRIKSASGENYIAADQDGAVTAYYDNTARLATTTTGIDVTGSVTADSAVIDNITIDGTEIDSSSSLSLDIAGNLTIDVDGSTVTLADGGVNFGQFYQNAAGQFNINSPTQDKDIVFLGNDGGSSIEAMRIDMSAGGNVGIGTSPSEKLHVAGALRIANNSADTYLGFGSNSDNYISTASGGATIFRELSTERMRIDASGNVGIGTSSPGTKLSVVDTSAQAVQLSLQNSGRDWRIGPNSGVGSSSLVFYDNTASQTRLVIDSSGNVGIGESSPDAKLHITDATDGGSSSVTSAIQFSRRNGGSNDAAIKMQHDGSDGVSNLQFHFGASERMRIDSSGNLLVGKTNNTLSNDGTIIRAGGEILVTNTSDIVANFNRTGTDGSIVQLYKDGSTVGSIASVGGSDIKVVFSSDGDQYITGNAASNYLTFSSANAERMRLDSSGNLLVGTTNTTPGISDTDTGISMSAVNGIIVSRDGEAAANFNRNNSDGDIVLFRKDGAGTAVGSIGAKGGTAYLIGSSKGLRVSGSGVIPITTGGTNSDATYDIGDQAVRFKDLYLSGGVVASASSGNSAHTFTATANNTRATLTTSAKTSGGVAVQGVLGSYGDASKIDIGTLSNHATAFITNNTEVGRFDASGNLLVGTTSNNPAGTTAQFVNQWSGGAKWGASFDQTVSSGTAYTHINFSTNGTNVGSINANNTTTTYNTSSDQRLKDNIVDAPSASDDIDAIQVRSFDWKADGSHQKYGMVAQELQSVAPEAVSEGATEEDMMGVDYSKLVPMLVKEIQSLRARVAQLEGEN